MTKSVSVIGTRGYPSYYGGFETAIRKIAPYLAERGWDVTVYGRGPVSLRPGDVVNTSVKRVNTLGFEKKSLSTLSYGFTSVVHAIRKKPDVALVMNVANGYWLPLLKMAGIRTVVNVDGIEWERAKWGKLAKTVFKTGAKMTALFADELIADSKEIQRRWKTEFKRNSTFIPYGGEESPKLYLESQFTSGKYILLVARFVPENTVEEFFDAVGKLPDDLPVVIVGSSGYASPLDDRAAALNVHNANVTWLGHVSDDDRLHALWQHAGVYFHGHSVGGTNPALVQAMACGARIVARDTVYNREVLGDAATFVQPDATSISTGILEAMSVAEPEAARDKARLRERVRGIYNWNLVCDSYESAILNQLGRGKS